MYLVQVRYPVPIPIPIPVLVYCMVPTDKDATGHKYIRHRAGFRGSPPKFIFSMARRRRLAINGIYVYFPFYPLEL